MRYLVLALLMLVSISSLAGEVRYVSDELRITLRTGKGNAYQILRTLRSGTRVEVLEEDGEFIRVRTDRGTEGWVRAQYLVTEPIAEHRLAAARDKATRLSTKVDDLTARVNALTSERDNLSDALSKSETTVDSLKKEVAQLNDVAAKPIRLNKENRFLKTRVANLELELTEASRENRALRKGGQRQWFITGAAVAVVGILLGLILPNLRARRRRSSGWS